MSATKRNTRVQRKKGGGDGDAKSAVPKKRPKGGADGDAKRAAVSKSKPRR